MQPEEETTTEDPDEESVVTTGSYLGCYKDDDNFPILDFLYEDEEGLTPAVSFCYSRQVFSLGVVSPPHVISSFFFSFSLLLFSFGARAPFSRSDLTVL